HGRGGGARRAGGDGPSSSPPRAGRQAPRARAGLSPAPGRGAAPPPESLAPMVLIRRVRRRWRLWVLVLAAAGLSARGGGPSGPGTESGTTSTTAGPPPQT